MLRRFRSVASWCCQRAGRVRDRLRKLWERRHAAHPAIHRVENLVNTALLTGVSMELHHLEVVASGCLAIVVVVGLLIGEEA
jgi:hypothetical protein